jgi:DNA-binding transcriptional regulator YiaG
MWTPAKVRTLRKRYGESQPEFAARISVHPETLRGWEQGRYTPEGPTALLLARLEEDIDSGQPRPHPDAVAV